MVHTGLAINKLEQGTENTFRGRDDNATVLQELSEKAMQERATLEFLLLLIVIWSWSSLMVCFFSLSNFLFIHTDGIQFSFFPFPFSF